MRAWLFHELGDMRLEEIPDPVCGPGEVLLKIRVVEPSVTEAILAAGGETVRSSRIAERLQAGPAQLFGHEYCADVVDVGAGVTRIAVGDRVANRALLPCGTCAICREGHPDECRRGPSTGIDFAGCLAEYAVLPHFAVAPLPDGVSDYEAAAIQPAADCVAAVDTARPQPGDTVAVIGQGAMGIFSLQAARNSLARKLIAIDVRPEPLEMARTLGADHCINAAEVDPVEAVRELTDGRGADVVIETAGGPPKEGLAGSGTLGQALGMVRDSGRVVPISLIPGEVPIDFLTWRMRSVQLVFPMMASIRHLETTIDMVAQRRLQIDPMISHIVWGLEEAPTAFAITGEKARYHATGPCQIVVDTFSVPRDPRIIRPGVG
jgi:threonine dehydrogenase-like Zn-dependent dehydrogenase